MRTQSGSQLLILGPAIFGWDGIGETGLYGAWGKKLQSMEEGKQRNTYEFQK